MAELGPQNLAGVDASLLSLAASDALFIRSTPCKMRSLMPPEMAAEPDWVVFDRRVGLRQAKKWPHARPNAGVWPAGSRIA